jgi:hypothetical protein
MFFQCFCNITGFLRHCVTAFYQAVIILFFCVSAVFTQHANDTLLFIVKLDDDTIGLYGCRWGEPIRNSLSGPVIMQDHNLLFYSRDGYALCDQRGLCIDEQSLIRKNRTLSRTGQPPIRLAYPVDKSTLVYYSESSGTYRETPGIFFQKRLFSHGMKTVNADAAFLSSETMGSSQLFNLFHNSITDEMAIKSLLTPHLVGYSSLDGGCRWWSIDKFYSFTSPLVMEENGAYRSFFPGFRDTHDKHIKKTLVEPLGVFRMNGQWYYYGVYSPGGTTQEEYLQRLFLCDQSGNLLYDNTILKMTVVDDVLGENQDEKLIYTVKRASRHVFLPSIDENGDIYYGIIDYKKKQIEVMKRLFYRFAAVQSGPALEDDLFREQGYVYNPGSTQCPEMGGLGSAFLPQISYAEPGVELKLLNQGELTKKGFFVKIARRKDEDLGKTITRIHQSLPVRVQKIQDSLSHLSTSWCPYSIVLNSGKKGELCTFHYGLGDIVVSARVLCVTSTFEVFVRVDLADWAEVVVFSTGGEFMNRFRFNNENFEVRNDLVAVSADRKIIEKDYEIGKGAYQFISWKLTTVAK